MTYDGEGHRIRLVETPASGSATTTDFRYQGDAVTSEVSVTGGTTITRTFTTDESGAIIKVAISGDPVSLHNGTYLVTWNGHGDAVALSKIDATTGALTAANRYTYTTWGTPTTTTHNSYSDLRFRYLYVGQYDVHWTTAPPSQRGSCICTPATTAPSSVASCSQTRARWRRTCTGMPPTRRSQKWIHPASGSGSSLWRS